MSDDPVELRAERLRLFIAVIGEESTMCAGEGLKYGLVPGGWTYYMGEQVPQDYPDEFDLAWSCAEVAQDLRERQWRALEEFGAAYSAGAGATAEERIKTMPADDARRALLAAFSLGWQHPAIEDDGA